MITAQHLLMPVQEWRGYRIGNRLISVRRLDLDLFRVTSVSTVVSPREKVIDAIRAEFDRQAQASRAYSFYWHDICGDRIDVCVDGHLHLDELADAILKGMECPPKDS